MENVLACSEPLQLGDEDHVLRQIFLPRMEARSNRSGGQHNYPECFPFAEHDGKRVESLIWEEKCEAGEVMRRGQEKAEADWARKKGRNPLLGEENKSRYAGFLRAQVRAIRWSEPGLFEVRHAPLADFFSHAQVELLPEYLEVVKRKVESDRPAGDGDVDASAARVVARDVLIAVFERGGLQGQLGHDAASLPAGDTPSQ
jgi:hypothetical protein